MTTHGQITSFRHGRKTQTMNQVIVQVKASKSKDDASKFVGKSVSFKTAANNEIKGKVSAVHGGNGAVRVHFERGMPGQSIGKEVTIE